MFASFGATFTSFCYIIIFEPEPKFNITLLDFNEIRQSWSYMMSKPLYFSGAGKTTFLVSLAGKCTLPSEGSVMINSKNVKDLNAVEIVPQFEVFVDGLSVMEHLVFMVSGSISWCFL